MTTYSNSLEARKASAVLDFFKHPDYVYYSPDWEMIRDALSGERRVKEQGTKYLPSPAFENSGSSYAEYIQRAVYVNMSARTVSGLVGTVFRRPLRVEGTNDSFDERLKTVSLDGNSLNLFAKLISYELFSVGRIGLLVDMGSDNTPYVVQYIAENILSWKTEVRNGKRVLTYVLLREIVSSSNVVGEDIFSDKPSTVYYSRQDNVSSRLYEQFRVLKLDSSGYYIQQVFKATEAGASADLSRNPDEIITPMRNGKRLDAIPFVIVGPLSVDAEVQKSPIIDIVNLNYAHYRSSAQLEHGRFFTAMPIYVVPVGTAGGQSEYVIGPSVVWEVPLESNPKILEYYGGGLNGLENSLTAIEEYISQLGGRIMGIRSEGAAESELVYKMKQANELSILLNVTESLNEALTTVVQWIAWWGNYGKITPEVHLNQDFKSLNIASRELRALALLYQQGILPIQEVHRILQDAEFIDETISIDEFIGMLSNLDNFPNQPDVQAMTEGYSDADARLRDKISKREVDAEVLAVRTKAKTDNADRLSVERQVKQQTNQDTTFPDGRRLEQLNNQNKNNG